MSRRRHQTRKQDKIGKILSEFRGLKEISAIKGTHQTPKIDEIEDKNGDLTTGKENIANVFADFYEDLYKARLAMVAAPLSQDGAADVEAISLQELVESLAEMRRGKARDDSGVIAETLRDGSELLLQEFLDLFNDVLSMKREVPTAWKQTRLTMIFKRGDRKNVGNYRPIAIVPVLYKAFSRILCKRVLPDIIRAQTVEQAAYRKGFSTDDHMLTVTLLIEKACEHNSPLWIGLVGFLKAFDTVEHCSLWEVLRQQNVHQHYINLLRCLYSDQVAYVQAGAKSRTISLARGVKQGDPISSLLFIAVMQACF